MSAIKSAWRFWKEWRPLVLWPISWLLFVAALAHGLFFDEYARATFLLVLSHIIERDATETAERYSNA